jgi:aspartate-semialdehyde dehydrogenase
MRAEPIIVVTGATGLIGGELALLCGEAAIPNTELRLLAEDDAGVGEVYQVGSQEFEVEAISENRLADVDIVLNTLSAEKLAPYRALLEKQGTTIIDTVPSRPMNPEIGVFVNGINDLQIREGLPYVACASAVVAILATVLKPLQQLAPLKRVVLSTYQSVSGAGQDAVDELWEQTVGIFNQQEVEPSEFQHPIAFNCIPQIDVMQEDGNTREEASVALEMRSVLAAPQLRLSVTSVRVPVLHSLAISVNVSFASSVTLETILEILGKEANIRLYSGTEYPMHRDATSSDEVHVGRVRIDRSEENCFNLWIVADNLRRGVALNALGLMRLIIDRARGH